MSTHEKMRMTEAAAAALLDFGPRALTALDHMIEAVDVGKVARCECCDLRRVEHFRNEQVRAQLVGMRDRLAKFVTEAHEAIGHLEVER